eukprot:jgi/Psemu1/46816/gm1.46816_g
MSSIDEQSLTNEWIKVSSLSSPSSDRSEPSHRFERERTNTAMDGTRHQRCSDAKEFGTEIPSEQKMTVQSENRTQTRVMVTSRGFEPPPIKTTALTLRLRPLGHNVNSCPTDQI